MIQKRITGLTAVSFATTLALAACGGGGGGNSGSSSNNSTSTGSTSTTAASPTTGNVNTAQYANGSAQLAAFQLLNQERQQCGFQPLTENTVLDSAAAAHASYMGQNGGTITDTEVSGNPGFTGATYVDRAAHFGFPTTGYVGGVSAGDYTNATLTSTEYGQQLVYEWLSGVYHIAVGVWPITEVGVGVNQTTYNNFPQIEASLSIANLGSQSGTTPLTFPCQGTTGVAYESLGESPTPPNTTGPSGSFGTPIAIAGNPTDTIVLTSGTMTDTSGTVITLQLLDSANDPNKGLPAFEAVAYPAAPIQPNTTYTVALTGTANGTAFLRSFSFTTGNVIG
jgi:uncharacterized protein YkwD